MKSIPKNFIIGIALIVTCAYYFYRYSSFAKTNFNIFILDITTLFITALILFFLIFKFLEILKRNKKYKLYKLCINIFISYLIVQSIKAFIFLANSKITLSNLIISTFSNYFDNSIILNRLIIFIFPYIIFFLLLNFLKSKKYEYNFLNFLKITGFIFLTVVFYREGINITSFKVEEVNKNIQLNNVDSSRKVLWVVFDGFDPEIYSEYKNILKLKNLIEFENNGIFVPKTYSPAKKTINSIPSMLMGVETKGHIIKNKKYYLKKKDNTLINFSFENSIFGELNNNNLKSSVLSSVIQYCSAYSKSNNFKLCKEKDVDKENITIKKITSGINFAFSPIGKLKFLYSIFTKKEKIVEEIKINFNQIKISKKIELINDLDGHKTIYLDDLKKSLRISNLTFLHLYIPHPGNYEYAEKLFGLKTQNELYSHLLNLIISDITLGKIIQNLNIYNDHMIILSSDHWFRSKDTKTKKIYPSLFMAKIGSVSENKIITMEQFKSVYIKELILKYFNKEINNNADIKNFIVLKN